MARKYFYYVGVQNNNGMSFVTSIDNRNRMCHWDTDKKPLAMSSTTANDLAEGLMMNFFTAVVVKSFFELDKHFVSEEETVKQKVTDALKQLGYTGEVHIATASVGRITLKDIPEGHCPFPIWLKQKMDFTFVTVSDSERLVEHGRFSRL